MVLTTTAATAGSGILSLSLYAWVPRGSEEKKIVEDPTDRWSAKGARTWREEGIWGSQRRGDRCAVCCVGEEGKLRTTYHPIGGPIRVLICGNFRPYSANRSSRTRAGRGRKLIGRNPVNLIVGWCGQFLFLLSSVNFLKLLVSG